MTSQKKKPSEAAVREIRRRTRRKFSPEEKIRIVLERLRGEQSGSDLCRREGFASNGFGAHPPGGYALGSAFISEVVLMLAFLFIILGCTDLRRGHRRCLLKGRLRSEGLGA
jgi:hypothetical protein